MRVRQQSPAQGVGQLDLQLSGRAGRTPRSCRLTDRTGRGDKDAGTDDCQQRTANPGMPAASAQVADAIQIKALVEVTHHEVHSARQSRSLSTNPACI